jgi:hypothetical protein
VPFYYYFFRLWELNFVAFPEGLCVASKPSPPKSSGIKRRAADLSQGIVRYFEELNVPPNTGLGLRGRF